MKRFSPCRARLRRLRVRERDFEALAPLLDMAACPPEGIQRGRQSQARLCTFRLSATTFERCPQVVVFAFKAVKPCRLLRSIKLRFRRLGQLEKVVPMARLQRPALLRA